MAFGEGLNKAWCLEQLFVYSGYGFGRKSVEEMLDVYNINRKYFFIFEVNNRVVKIKSKPNFFSEEELCDSTDTAVLRAINYKNLFQHVINTCNVDINTVFGMEMPDEVFESVDVPVFGYQKQAHHKVLLMPDIDFLNYDFYRLPLVEDTFAYNEKDARGVFFGATTGAGMITEEALNKKSVRRINSALFFKDHESVDFKLPDIVQVASDDVRRMIADMDLGGERREWPEQLKYKFLISMDGNGATCSRVVISLKSNSVLLKYDSPNMLYYFSGLIPWYNFIPIQNDKDILRIIELERLYPGYFESVATNGRDFYNANLQRERVFEYVALLIKGYSDLIH